MSIIGILETSASHFLYYILYCAEGLLECSLVLEGG